MTVHGVHTSEESQAFYSSKTVQSEKLILSTFQAKTAEDMPESLKKTSVTIKKAQSEQKSIYDSSNRLFGAFKSIYYAYTHTDLKLGNHIYTVTISDLAKQLNVTNSKVRQAAKNGSLEQLVSDEIPKVQAANFQKLIKECANAGGQVGRMSTELAKMWKLNPKQGLEALARIPADFPGLEKLARVFLDKIQPSEVDEEEGAEVDEEEVFNITSQIAENKNIASSPLGKIVYEQQKAREIHKLIVSKPGQSEEQNKKSMEEGVKVLLNNNIQIFPDLPLRILRSLDPKQASEFAKAIIKNEVLTSKEGSFLRENTSLTKFLTLFVKIHISGDEKFRKQCLSSPKENHAAISGDPKFLNLCEHGSKDEILNYCKEMHVSPEVRDFFKEMEKTIDSGEPTKGYKPGTGLKHVSSLLLLRYIAPLAIPDPNRTPEQRKAMLSISGQLMTTAKKTPPSEDILEIGYHLIGDKKEDRVQEEIDHVDVPLEPLSRNSESASATALKSARNEEQAEADKKIIEEKVIDISKLAIDLPEGDLQAAEAFIAAAQFLPAEKVVVLYESVLSKLDLAKATDFGLNLEGIKLDPQLSVAISGLKDLSKDNAFRLSEKILTIGLKSKSIDLRELANDLSGLIDRDPNSAQETFLSCSNVLNDKAQIKDLLGKLSRSSDQQRFDEFLIGVGLRTFNQENYRIASDALLEYQSEQLNGQPLR